MIVTLLFISILHKISIFFIISHYGFDVNILARNYIVLCISEQRIRTETSLVDLMEEITNYLIKNYYESMRNLPDFYRKFVYNESELYDFNPSVRIKLPFLI